MVDPNYYVTFLGGKAIGTGISSSSGEEPRNGVSITFDAPAEGDLSVCDRYIFQDTNSDRVDIEETSCESEQVALKDAFVFYDVAAARQAEPEAYQDTMIAATELSEAVTEFIESELKNYRGPSKYFTIPKWVKVETETGQESPSPFPYVEYSIALVMDPNGTISFDDSTAVEGSMRILVKGQNRQDGDKIVENGSIEEITIEVTPTDSLGGETNNFSLRYFSGADELTDIFGPLTDPYFTKPIAKKGSYIRFSGDIIQSNTQDYKDYNNIIRKISTGR